MWRFSRLHSIVASQYLLNDKWLYEWIIIKWENTSFLFLYTLIPESSKTWTWKIKTVFVFSSEFIVYEMRPYVSHLILIKALERQSRQGLSFPSYRKWCKGQWFLLSKSIKRRKEGRKKEWEGRKEERRMGGWEERKDSSSYLPTRTPNSFHFENYHSIYPWKLSNSSAIIGPGINTIRIDISFLTRTD